MVARAGRRIEQPWAQGGWTWWLEHRDGMRPSSVVMVRDPKARLRRLTPAGFSVGTRAYTYGGGDLHVDQAVAYFVSSLDQGLWRQSLLDAPRPLVRQTETSFADLWIDRTRRRLLCVGDCSAVQASGPATFIASIGLSGAETPVVLVGGADFYCAPRPSPDGRCLSWISWDHPLMPWDGSRLWLAELDADGRPTQARLIAGGPCESVCQPQWSPGGELHFVSDRSGWWNIYRLRHNREVEAVWPLAADFARPRWAFGACSYSFASDDLVVCSLALDGRWQLGVVDLVGGGRRILTGPQTEVGQWVRTDGQRVVFSASADDRLGGLRELRLDGGAGRELRGAGVGGLRSLRRGYLAAARPLSFATAGGFDCHAWYYAPTNSDHRPAPGELPPLLVNVHGGPTGSAERGLDFEVQYWTSRGFAFADINHRGSSGFGRRFRQSLLGGWGIVEVQDCCALVDHLIAGRLADPRRVLIRGKSAGGFTALCAAIVGMPFRAAASYYGISDLEHLAANSVKFESHYESRLVGGVENLSARSPINLATAATAPVILFHGDADPAVPVLQSRLMSDRLAALGVPVAQIIFAGEGHGFRRADSIIRALEAELAFYRLVLRLPGANRASVPGLRGSPRWD